MHMADELIPIRITFKAGPAQSGNLEHEYKITRAELDRLADDLLFIPASQQPPRAVGAYDVTRVVGGRGIQTRLILRLSEVLAVG